MWQFLPYCVWLSKLGEHFNQSPIFVFDSTPKLTIAGAKETNQRYLLTGKAEETEHRPNSGRRSVWTLEHNESAEDSLLQLSVDEHLESSDLQDFYWIVKVDSPNVDEDGMPAHVDGEGMFVWIEEDEETIIADGAHLAFIAYAKEIGADLDIKKSDQSRQHIRHGRQLTGCESARMAFDTVQHFGKEMYDGKGDLPTPQEPLFCSSTTILVKLSTPAQDRATVNVAVSSRFKIHACYSEAPPIAFEAGTKKRLLFFIFYVTLYVGKMMIVFSPDMPTMCNGVALWTLSAGLLTLTEYISEIWEFIVSNAKDLRVLKDPGAWQQLRYASVNSIHLILAVVSAVWSAVAIALVMTVYHLVNYDEVGDWWGVQDTCTILRRFDTCTTESVGQPR